MSFSVLTAPVCQAVPIHFALIAEKQLSPICAPWLFVETLSSGYISKSGKDGDHIRTQIDDSFAGEQLHMEVWTEVSGKPIFAEIVWREKRILSITIDDFKLL